MMRLLGRRGQTSCIPVARDHPTLVALSFYNRSAVTRTTLSIGATIGPPPANHAAAHHWVHVGITTPLRTGR
jgi:hypothetical protein